MEIMNTTEEQEVLTLVQSILDQNICTTRISRSEARTYMAIIMDNNSHRTICRLYLGARQKYIGTISERKVETRTQIKDICDIKAFSMQLNEAVRRYANM
jgi:hypothetical protein